MKMEDSPRKKEIFTGWASLSTLTPLSSRLICSSHEHVNILQTSVQSVKAHVYKHRNADHPAHSRLKHSFLTCHCMCLVCITNHLFPVCLKKHFLARKKSKHLHKYLHKKLNLVENMTFFSDNISFSFVLFFQFIYLFLKHECNRIWKGLVLKQLKKKSQIQI